jgi:hypothetical protein
VAAGGPSADGCAGVAGERGCGAPAVAHVKTFVRVLSPQRPAPATDSSWRDPVGQALELVPEVDPTALEAGDTLRVRLLGAGGTPEPDATVTLMGAGAPPAGLVARTDVQGRAAFRLAAGGRWRVRAAPARDGHRHAATLTGTAR